MAVMMDAIVRALRRNEGVHDWQVRKTRIAKHELYIIGEDVETARAGLTESADVTLYHDHDGKRGEATLTFVPGELDDGDARIDRGVFRASMAGNPPHRLPGPFQQPDIQVRDPVLAGDPDGIIDGWRRSLVATVKDELLVRLSAAEFFVYEEEFDFLNSQGASYSYPATRAFIEFVLLSRDEDKESENYHSVRVRSAADLNLAAVARDRAALARDMLRVSLPKTWTGPVVISGEPLAGLFEPFLSRANAEPLYRHIFQTKIGDSLLREQEVRGDPLNLAVDPTLAFGLASAPADGEGLPARRLEILRDGRVQNIVAAKRFADYLGLAPTGTSGNTVVAAGSTPESELLRGPAYHLVSFAGLYADPMTGEFVSEIRLGYEVDQDGSRRPVKGGSVSGNVFDAFAACRMTRETCKVGSYFGPHAIRFDKLVISGQ